MRRKYAHTSTRKPGSTRGRPIRPEKWITGPDPITHEKYYAFLKHRAQAQFRGEDYELDFDSWCEHWSDELFLRRGRRVEDLCLQRIDQTLGWSLQNTEVVTRQEHLARKRKRANDGG